VRRGWGAAFDVGALAFVLEAAGENLIATRKNSSRNTEWLA